MVARKQIRLNAFNMNCVGHINHGLWTHPRDRSSDYNTLRYWTDQAKLLERGLFDGLFIADISGVYDIYGGGIDVTAREAVQLPVNDPSLLVPAMAAVTEHLGFGVTVNVHTEAPYTFARRLSTLDHLTGGRIGWNIVTGYLDSAHRGLSGGTLPAMTGATTMPTSISRCSTSSGRAAGTTRRYAETGKPGVQRSGPYPPGLASRHVLRRRGLSPVRALRAAHAGALPGGASGAAGPSPGDTPSACSSRPATGGRPGRPFAPSAPRRWRPGAIRRT